MAKLTDLPDEVLTLIFRNFLSSALTNHSYLCEWNFEAGRVKNPANLCCVALVSKSFHAQAMHLLFQQLPDLKDVEIMSKSQHSRKSGLRWANHILYANVMIRSYSSLEFRTFARELLEGCTRLQHLKLSIFGSPDNSTDYLSFLVGVARASQLRSLSIALDLCQSAPTALEQLSFMDSLRGLEMVVIGCNQYEMPTKKLPMLMAFKLGNGDDDRIGTACLSLVCPQVLKEATLTVSDSGLLPRAFAQHRWMKLEKLALTVNEENAIRAGTIDLSPCPALRRLICGPESDKTISYKEKLPIIPPGVLDLEFVSLNMEEVSDVFCMALEGQRLGQSLRYLRFDLDYLEETPLECSSEEKEAMLQLARKAVGSLQSRGIELDPSDLVRKLADIPVVAST